MAFLELNNICKTFINDTGKRILALKDLSFKCEKGEFVAFVGSTGCGKTTALRIIAGLESPTAGEMTINDKRVEGTSKNTTLLFQQNSLFPWLNVIDNVAFSLEMQGVNKVERRKKARELLKLVHLEGVEHSYPYELSGGMQQRASIARALAHDSELLLLDEPFGALDERTRHHLQDELLGIWQKNRKTVLLVTHNIDEAIFLADRIIVMRDSPGTIEEIIDLPFKHPRDRRSKKFSELHLNIRELLEQIITR